jgi:hypothetical protein
MVGVRRAHITDPTMAVTKPPHVIAKLAMEAAFRNSWLALRFSILSSCEKRATPVPDNAYPIRPST